MARQILVVHERIGTWARQLRPRLGSWPLRLVETRSARDLEPVLASSACPLILLDVGGRPRAALEDLQRAVMLAPDALVLVLNPLATAGIAPLAWELGATYILDGPSTPPEIIGWLTRWLPLARRRTEAAGRAWLPPRPPEAEPWAWLTPYLGERGGPEWTAWPGA